MDGKITLYCDAPNPRHPRKHPRVLVTTFNHHGDGRWGENVESPRVQGLLAQRGNSGTTLTGNERYHVSEHGMAPNVPTRAVYSLACAICAKPYEYREATLFAALNEAHRVGVADLTLAQLGSIVQGMAQQSAPDERE